MAELLVVGNPKKRRRRHRVHRARSRRRHRKMTAKQLKYFGPRSSRSHRRRRRRTVVTVKNPHRRHHRSRRNPHRRHYRRHRNPSTLRGLRASFMPTVKSGFVGAVGGLATDGVWGAAYQWLGVNSATAANLLSNPYAALLGKAVASVLVGSLGGKVWRGRGPELARGAMTVTLHDFLKANLQTMAPTLFGTGGFLPLGAYLSGSAPIVGTASNPKVYMPFGAYLSGSTGANDNGNYTDDVMGENLWAGADYR